jgi:3-dehydroquinate synthase
MSVIKVSLGERSYDIVIGTDLLAHTAQFIAERTKSKHAIVITDENVERLHGEVVLNSLSSELARVDLVAVPAGEKSKCADFVAALWEKMLELETDRKSIVIALGGGVVGDLAGFVAASFTRGLSFFQIPTTLLAQVDSSVGGKTGINLSGAKNMVGSFWQPSGVLADTSVLATQSERDYLSGLAEVVKYGVIMDAEFFELLEERTAELLSRNSKILETIVARSCALKAQVVKEDEREETGRRAILNYGHTFAHAIETVGGYGELLHGEAVSIGMTYAARLSARLGRVDDQFVERQTRLLSALKLPVTLPKVFDADELIAAMKHDKKVEHGKLRFVLPDKLGNVELIELADMNLVKTVIEN